jgi:fatty acid synthase
VNPENFRNTRTGVFVGASTSEAENAYNDTTDTEEISGYTLTGCCRAMFSNRISFAFDFTGAEIENISPRNVLALNGAQ